MNPILASAIIPGWGESILEKKAQARTFLIIEGSLWTAYLGFNYIGHKIDYSARAFAIQHAGANPARRDDKYFDVLEDYFTSNEYNLEVERDASYYYPDDLEAQQAYIRENGYFDEDAWEWDPSTDKNYYWERRKESRENLRRASFMTGFMIINRIVSVINVAVFAGQERVGLDTKEGRIGLYYKF